MSYYDDDETREGFKMSEDDTDEPLDVPEDMDFGLDEEDPDKDR